MTEAQQLLEQAITKYDTAYKFCKTHNLSEIFISRMRRGLRPVTLSIAQIIACDLSDDKDEQDRLVGRILRSQQTQ